MPLPRLKGEIIAFRRYWLAAGPRLLLADGVSVDIGMRALELLILLIEARGNVVSLDDIKQFIWPRAHIASNTAQALVSSLRKALRDDADLISTVPGRGYRFTDTPRLVDARDMALAEGRADEAALGPGTAPGSATARQGAGLLARAPQARLGETPFIGRHAELSELLALLAAHRVVSITGALGVGKTRLAAQVAERLSGSLAESILCVDLATHMRPDGVAEALLAAATRGPPDDAVSATNSLIGMVSQRATLLIVEHCDHLAEAVRRLLEVLIAAAPALRVIVTSETPLFIAGERVVTVAPLAAPPCRAERGTAGQAHDALRLLLERLALALAATHAPVALRPRLEARHPLGDPRGSASFARAGDTDETGDTGDASVTGDIGSIGGIGPRHEALLDSLGESGRATAETICRRLDNLPLALELAASTIAHCTRPSVPWQIALSAYALSLEDALAQRSAARRIALPRAALMSTVLELAYAALAPGERAALRHLSILVGPFSAAGANRLLARCAGNSAPGDTSRATGRFDGDLGGLVRAGMVERLASAGQILLRLPEPVRLFALAALNQRRILDDTARHHAQHVLAELADAAGQAARHAPEGQTMPIDNLRAALYWAAQHGKFDLCAALLEHSAPRWRELALVAEYLDWIGIALAGVEAAPLRSLRDAMRLHCARAGALTLEHAPSVTCVAAWRRAYELATVCADAPYRLRALRGLLACALGDGLLDWARELHGTYAQIVAAVPAGQAA